MSSTTAKFTRLSLNYVLDIRRFNSFFHDPFPTPSICVPTSDSLADSSTISDFYDGSEPASLHKRVREELGHYIVPSTNESAPCLPNFFAKGRVPLEVRLWLGGKLCMTVRWLLEGCTSFDRTSILRLRLIITRIRLHPLPTAVLVPWLYIQIIRRHQQSPIILSNFT